MFDQYENAKDEVRGRIESLNGKIKARRARAEEDRKSALDADADAERMIRIRDEYEALLSAQPVFNTTVMGERLA